MTTGPDVEHKGAGAFDEIDRRLAELDGLEIHVGFQGQSALEVRRPAPATPSKRKTTIVRKIRRLLRGRARAIRLVDIATIHEFGAPGAGIPERSFMRSTFDEKRKSLQGHMAAAIKLVMQGRPVSLAVGRVGVALQGYIQAKIVDLKEPPLAPSTIRARMRRTGDANPNPLVDTGQLKNGVRYIITRNGRRIDGDD